jgi:predicted PhzF superfamily epimerase YddE/YHI9|tara:strand:- start:6748 stop:7557 length:810 start_codon:yes stop_codon:yes gene_type:complete
MTMTLRQYQVDAFAERVFEGNPAAVVPLQVWLDDSVLQAIAEENNLAETAFFVPSGEGYALRWFTPAAEVDLCGHATLAAAHVLYTQLGYDQDCARFFTRSGELQVRRAGERYLMDLPAVPVVSCPMPPGLAAALGSAPVEVHLGGSYLLAVYASEEDVRGLRPNFALLSEQHAKGVIATAPGQRHDFVSRFFAPSLGVPEDPVTGSAHCRLAPYWAERLGKNRMSARQVSSRGGELGIELRGTRVQFTGGAVLFLAGELHGLGLQAAP